MLTVDERYHVKAAAEHFGRRASEIGSPSAGLYVILRERLASDDAERDRASDDPVGELRAMPPEPAPPTGYEACLPLPKETPPALFVLNERDAAGRSVTCQGRRSLLPVGPDSARRFVAWLNNLGLRGPND